MLFYHSLIFEEKKNRNNTECLIIWTKISTDVFCLVEICVKNWQRFSEDDTYMVFLLVPDFMLQNDYTDKLKNYTIFKKPY